MEQPAGGDTAMCPFEIARPLMIQRWEQLTFLHWAFEPGEIRRLVPEELTLEEMGGRAWVGLVPFYMRIALPNGRLVPWLSNFCETNLRTYVRDPAGRPGIWFFSVDAARLAAVAGARAGLRLPYCWSRMELSSSGDVVEYSSRRRLPPPGVHSRIRVRVGDRCDQDEPGDLGRFLTARWRLFSVSGRFRRMAPVCHPPWVLHRAEVLEIDDGVLSAAGLPGPAEPPLVHFCPGVEVRVGAPERW